MLWPVTNIIAIQVSFTCRNWLYMIILWPRVISTEFRCNSCNSVTFNPHYKNRVFEDNGYWDRPGHVVALNQSRFGVAIVRKLKIMYMGRIQPVWALTAGRTLLLPWTLPRNCTWDWDWKGILLCTFYFLCWTECRLSLYGMPNLRYFTSIH